MSFINELGYYKDPSPSYLLGKMSYVLAFSWTVILVPRFLLVFFESLVLCDLFQKSCLKLRLTAIELNRKVGFPQHGGRIGEGEEICVSWRHQLSARALFEQTRQAMPMRRRNATAIHGSSHLCFISAAVGPPFLT